MRKTMMLATIVATIAMNGWVQGQVPSTASPTLVEATDLNPDPKTVEINLEARVSPVEIAGVTVNAWTYNGGVPGPLIRAHVGDRLIVHFKNALPQSSTIHWHGVRVPIQMDGVPGISQPDVEPGGSFTYDFILPDAGLFWYHPHVQSAMEVGYGLYGPLLVEDPRETAVPAAVQRVFVLSDIAFDDATGKLDPPDNGGDAGSLFGREGNHLLVNGRERATLPFRNGELQRWRFVNSAKSRYFNLVLGNSQPFMLIGVDGGLVESSIAADHLVLAPGERADILVAPRVEGPDPLVLRSFPFDRGYGSIEYRAPEDLMTLVATGEPAIAPAPLPQVQHVIAPMSSEGAVPIQLDLIMVTQPNGKLAFGIGGGPFWKGTSVRSGLGEKQLWTITNKAVWAHPIHIHGFFFQEVDEHGTPIRPIQLKDTISVPAEKTVHFLVVFDRPGSWMYHCHILDHAESGLMSTIDVGGETAPMPMDHMHPAR